MPIQYIGLDSLKEKDIAILTKISEKSFPKLERYYKNETLIIRIKEHSKQGKRSKFSLHAKIDAPNIKIAAQSDDWDIAKATHKIFNKLEQEARHKLKI